MHTLHAYNPAVMRNIKLYVLNCNWEGLCQYFKNLSNSEFRTACNMMAENVLMGMTESDYWACFRVLFMDNPKAWLVTLLKAALKRYRMDSLHFETQAFEEICVWIHREERKIDERKMLQNILSELRTPEEIENILSLLQLTDEQCVRYLIEHSSTQCYYVLFQKMRRMDSHQDRLSFYCAELLRKGDDKSFNLVSIVKNYFDLPAVKGIFSLKINPYELSRLDSSYELFCQMINKI